MFSRLALGRVRQLLSRHAAVGLLGPRQVGKTTLALQLAAERPSIYLDLESPRDLAKTPRPGRGVTSACEDLRPERAFVVYPGAEELPVAADVIATPLVVLARRLLEERTARAA